MAAAMSRLKICACSISEFSSVERKPRHQSSAGTAASARSFALRGRPAGISRFSSGRSVPRMHPDNPGASKRTANADAVRALIRTALPPSSATGASLASKECDFGVALLMGVTGSSCGFDGVQCPAVRSKDRAPVPTLHRDGSSARPVMEAVVDIYSPGCSPVTGAPRPRHSRWLRSRKRSSRR